MDDDDGPRAAFGVVGERSPDEGPPVDGMDYLKMVRYQARRTGNVFVSNIDPHAFAKNQTAFYQEKPDDACEPAPLGLAPDPVWQEKYNREFVAFRSHIASLRENLISGPGSQKFPSKGDSIAWKIFCFGKPAAVTEAPVLEDGEEPEPPAGHQDAEPSLPKLPHLNMLIHLDEVTTAKLTNHHLSWIIDDEDAITIPRLQWIFSLLCCVDQPINANTAANLRTFLRRLCKQRAQMTSNTDPMLAHVNTLITIITKCFGQRED